MSPKPLVEFTKFFFVFEFTWALLSLQKQAGLAGRRAAGRKGTMCVLQR